MDSLEGRVAIVTGGGTGIGAAIARALAAEGVKVALAARRRDRLEAVAAAIRQAGGTALAVPTDVTSEADVLALFERTGGELGPLDILVNNSGTAAKDPTDQLSLAEWNRVVGVNLTGPFLCSREALKAMKPRGSGRIVNIGSISGQVSRRHSIAYTATKFALEGMTRSLQLDARKHGIAVSILHPGNVLTDIWSGREEVVAREGAIDPDDLARMVVTMARLPNDVTLLTGVLVPITQPYLGRG